MKQVFFCIYDAWNSLLTIDFLVQQQHFKMQKRKSNDIKVTNVNNMLAIVSGAYRETQAPDNTALKTHPRKTSG